MQDIKQRRADLQHALLRIEQDKRALAVRASRIERKQPGEPQTLTQDLQRLEAERRELLADFETHLKDLGAQRERMQGEAARLDQRRAALIRACSNECGRAYDDLCQRGISDPVATLQGRVCGACGALAGGAQDAPFKICPGCKRLLLAAGAVLAAEAHE
ncbi:MAG: hypothetical protein MUF51_04915 [Vicinamibacteria bacterium]|nr:hypothetical protein [Vicinamibacteria bacterium]